MFSPTEALFFEYYIDNKKWKYNMDDDDHEDDNEGK